MRKIYLICSNAYVFRINLHKLSQWILDTSSNGHCRNTHKILFLMGIGGLRFS